MNFDECISRLDSELSIQKHDRELYAKDFDKIRDYLMGIMKATDPVFKMVYGGPSLFGSYLDNIKTDVPDEFDVHFLIDLPYYEEIELKLDVLRPGFVKVNLSVVLARMKADPNYNLVYQQFKGFVNGNGFLLRNKIKDWLQNIIETALLRYGYSVPNAAGTGTYNLSYCKRGTAHTFRAFCQNRLISIDFVPAFKFNADYDWFAQRPFPRNVKHKLWFAVPKPSVGPNRGRKLTFSICVPQVEKNLLTAKYNLKPTLRLFKCLRDKINSRNRHLMKSYFIKTIYLFENEKQGDEFWRQSVGQLLLQMLDKMLIYLDNGRIDFYWCPSMNLLARLDEDKIIMLKNYFLNARNCLAKFSKQPSVEYKRMRKLFGKSNSHQLKKENA